MKVAFLLATCVLISCFWTGCDVSAPPDRETITITDQTHQRVKIPKQVERIAALHHFGGKIIYALNQQHLLVEKSIYGREAIAIDRVDKAFAALPNLSLGHGHNIEGLVSLRPQIVFWYASDDASERQAFENAGLPVIAVKGETIEESFEAIRLMAGVLDCKQSGEIYIKACQDLLDLVKKRLSQGKPTPLKVLFSGPKSIYSVATGNMLQTRMLELAGAKNVAGKLKGFWANVSPEQVAAWNPDVVFLGSSLDAYGRDNIFKNPHFQTVRAIKDKRVFSFPSNIGWWDYPSPHCVLGVVWAAKTLYPDLFFDVDMMALANAFYLKFVGHTFEALGGRLDR